MKRRRQPAYEKSVFINCPFDPEKDSWTDLLFAGLFQSREIDNDPIYFEALCWPAKYPLRVRTCRSL